MNVAIIGGGACGLLLGSYLQRQKIQYTIFEKRECGRKLLASGNGKANLANRKVTLEDYHHHRLAYDIVTSYREKLWAYFKTLGLYTKEDEEGRIYPFSESSQTVLDCLFRPPLKVLKNLSVDSIQKISGRYYINSIYGPFDYVVCASGSVASFVMKKQQGYYDYLKSLKVKMTELRPSLVGFQTSLDLTKIAGTRAKATVTLKQKERIIHRESGEIIFKKDGISGICILNLSSYYAHLKDQSGCTVHVDLLSGLDIRISKPDDLVGLFHPKLVLFFNNHPEILPSVHDFVLPVTGVYDFEFAQVVCGGVETDQLNPDLSLIRDPHLFFGGEVLAVGGLCGGYNLMFAFCCALKIGETLCSIKSMPSK